MPEQDRAQAVAVLARWFAELLNDDDFRVKVDEQARENHRMGDSEVGEADQHETRLCRAVTFARLCLLTCTDMFLGTYPHGFSDLIRYPTWRWQDRIRR